MQNLPKKAFVLAAGLGSRMLDLTNDCPKPMLIVGGKTMLDHALDALEEVGVEEVVVNTHYLADIIHKHLETRTSPKITISHEEEVLETGGGVKNAIEFFGSEPFYVLNSDVVWTDKVQSSLKTMGENWDSDKMDLMLLLHPLETALFYEGPGDYFMEGDCAPAILTKFGRSDKIANYVVAGPRIVHPRLFENYAEGKSSFRDLFIKAEDAGRLYGQHHEGQWFHVGTPEALEETNKILSAQNKEKKIG